VILAVSSALVGMIFGVPRAMRRCTLHPVACISAQGEEPRRGGWRPRNPCRVPGLPSSRGAAPQIRDEVPVRVLGRTMMKACCLLNSGFHLLLFREGRGCHPFLGPVPASVRGAGLGPRTVATAGS
jgi:hypothetical protein